MSPILSRRLERWVEADLIEAGQAERIEAFERGRGRPLLLYAIAGLGGLAIAIGIVSIVAANWEAIPGRVKIAVDLALLAGLGAAVVRLRGRGPAWAAEAAIVALYGLTLASIALVGQVYQLGGEARTALAIWSGLTALLMSRARSGFVAAAWLAGLQATWFVWLVWWGAEHEERLGLALGAVYWVPLVCLAVGGAARVRRARPRLAAVFTGVGWAELVACGTAGTFGFYHGLEGREWAPLWAALAVSAALTAWLAWRTPAGRGRGPVQALLAACLALAHLPPLVSPGDLDVVAALAFIGLWLLVAVAAHRQGRFLLLNAATAVIGVRIVVVYFEVFGSLLGTGVGLVSGGLLTLGLLWLWTRKRRQFARQLGGGGAE